MLFEPKHQRNKSNSNSRFIQSISKAKLNSSYIKNVGSTVEVLLPAKYVMSYQLGQYSNSSELTVT